MADELIGYEVEIVGLDEALARLTKYDSTADARLSAAMIQSVHAIEGAVKPFAPVNTGHLRNSIGSQVIHESLGSIVGKVGSSLKDEEYPKVMEYGRKPGAMPPPEALLRWVHLKRITGTYSLKTRRRQGSKRAQAEEDYQAAYNIARAIGRRGLQGHFYLKHGWEKSSAKVRNYFRQALTWIAKDLAGEQ